MATVFVPPSPQTSMTMATRRPLANVPNATNSPHRAGLLPAKRSRSTQMEIPYGQPPPKKQVMEGMDYEAGRSATTNTQNTDSKLFARRSNNAVPSAFEKKLVAAREKERQPAAKPVKVENMDSIRQWQRHYRKAFPSFVFYFDSMPEEMRRKCSRQVIALGAVSTSMPHSRQYEHMFICFILPRFLRAHAKQEMSLTECDILARGEVLLTSGYPRCHFACYSP